jgi:hypothetical protein
MNKAIVLTLLLLTGCIAYDKHVDKLYGFSVNDEYTLLEDMYISGINLPPGYGNDVNIYTIELTQPSWGGPELISRETLE